VEATLHQLVAHELLLRLGLHPEWEPSCIGLIPDLTFQAHGTLFIADVFVTHSPSITVRDFADGTGEACDTSVPSESRAKKIAYRINEKAEKYKRLSRPLVLFGFLGDHYILSPCHFEQALYGRIPDEAEPGESFPDVGKTPVPLGGILLPQAEGKMPHEHLSAVVVIDWFDTLNRKDPGKRVHCLVLHHFAPSTRLPISAFEQFCQLIWEEQKPQSWKWRYTRERNIVAKLLPGGDEMKYASYSPGNPW
jgi:hypothetical protein